MSQMRRMQMGRGWQICRHLSPQFLRTGSRAPRQQEGSVTLPFPRTPGKSCQTWAIFGSKIFHGNIEVEAIFWEMFWPTLFFGASLPHPFWVACSRSSGARVLAAGRQLVGSAPWSGRLAGEAVVAGTLQRAPHRPLLLQPTATHQSATGGNFAPHFVSQGCIHPTAVLWWSLQYFGGQEKTENQEENGKLCESRAMPRGHCVYDSTLVTAVTGPPPLPSQNISTIIRKSIRRLLRTAICHRCRLQLHIGFFLTHQTWRNEDGQWQWKLTIETHAGGRLLFPWQISGMQGCQLWRRRLLG